MIDDSRTEIFHKAMVALEKYCAYQERCSSEVAKKMRSFELTDAERMQLDEYLLDERFYDDERFATAFVRGKYKYKYWGRKRISYELKMRGIGDSLIRKGMEEVKEEEYRDILERLATQKWNSAKAGNNYERKQKVFKYLYSKGFESELIQFALEDLEAAHPDED